MIEEQFCVCNDKCVICLKDTKYLEQDYLRFNCKKKQFSMLSFENLKYGMLRF
jgi:hypothetical protein